MLKHYGLFPTSISGLLLLISTNIVWCQEGYVPIESLVEMRAVFLRCAPDESHEYPDSETLRFERQEMFKHNALEDCNKKLAITLKMSSEPKSSFTTLDTNNTSSQSSFEDEYIPIDHVFEGPQRKRLRLLNPYILRLRREPPREAYPLQRIDVHGMSGSEVEEPDDSLIWNFDDSSFSLDQEPQRNFVNEISNSCAWTESPKKSDTLRNRLSKNKLPIDAINLKKFRTAKDYALYEIGDPELWHNITLQVFEKTSTPEGKILWSDLNNGEVAGMRLSDTDWRSKNMHVRYRSPKWVSRDDFVLPTNTRLALLVPLHENYNSDDDADPPADGDLDSSNTQFIVVPLEDVNYVNNKLHKRTANDSDTDNVSASEEAVTEKAYNRVEVRLCRAVLFGGSDDFKMSTTDKGQFFTLPHLRPIHTQVDLEVKADDNQLVRVGSSARLATIVADSSRKTHSTIHVQATNTGLAAAKFKVVARQCGPGLSTMVPELNPEHLSVGPILLPPFHTQRVRLQVPVDILADAIKCNIQLINEDNESVAIREVKIKKGDRCFCVWHCDCVCLSDDPKLLCREMSRAQQVAAGLPTAGRPRFERNVQYCEKFTVMRALGFIFGILLVFIALGFVKACLGLCFPKIGSCGHYLIIKPRRINKYFEKDIRERPVIYDEQGWPVHPDTGERSVRVLDWSTQFFINIVFFIAAVVILLNEYVLKSFQYVCKFICKAKQKVGPVNVFNAHDLKNESRQLIKRRKSQQPPVHRRWMSPEAEKVAGDFFQDITNNRCNCGPKVYASDEPCDDGCINQGLTKTEKQSLLNKTKLSDRSDCVSVANSEQHDTKYVLMQMQKSRESLARNQRKHNSAEEAVKIKSEISKSKKK